jgi:hypothetical protein
VESGPTQEVRINEIEVKLYDGETLLLTKNKVTTPQNNAVSVPKQAITKLVLFSAIPLGFTHTDLLVSLYKTNIMASMISFVQ